MNCSNRREVLDCAILLRAFRRTVVKRQQTTADVLWFKTVARLCLGDVHCNPGRLAGG